MALKGNEILYVQGIAQNGQPAAETEATTTQAIANLASLEDSSLSETAVTGVTGVTLTAAALVSGQIARSGPTANFTDTTDTAAAILAALPGVVVGSTFLVRIKNATAWVETLAGGTGVTVPTANLIAPYAAANYFVTVSSATAVTFTHMGTGVLDASIVTTIPALVANSATTGTTITAASIVSGYVNRTGPSAAFTDTTDLAANIIAAAPNLIGHIGAAMIVSYVNGSTGPATITGGTGVTVSGAATVAAGMTTDFLLTYTAAATITMVGIRTASNTINTLTLNGSSSGESTITAPATGGGAVALPVGAGTLAYQGGVGTTTGATATGTYSQASNTTLSTVTGMSATLLAGATYSFEIYLAVSAAATPGIKLNLGTGGNATMTSFLADTFVYSTTTLEAEASIGTFSSNLYAGAVAATVVRVVGSCVVNAGGTVILQAAQDVSNATALTITNGSFMTFTRLA